MNLGVAGQVNSPDPPSSRKIVSFGAGGATDLPLLEVGLGGGSASPSSSSRNIISFPAGAGALGFDDEDEGAGSSSRNIASLPDPEGLSFDGGGGAGGVSSSQKIASFEDLPFDDDDDAGFTGSSSTSLNIGILELDAVRPFGFDEVGAGGSSRRTGMFPDVVDLVDLLFVSGGGAGSSRSTAILDEEAVALVDLVVRVVEGPGAVSSLSWKTGILLDDVDLVFEWVGARVGTRGAGLGSSSAVSPVVPSGSLKIDI